jgi:hypothetical protein
MITKEQQDRDVEEKFSRMSAKEWHKFWREVIAYYKSKKVKR